MRLADILSAEVRYSGLQTHWAHRLKSLCFRDILLKSVSHAFGADEHSANR
jgi:hypothetical protein